jgi:hypothetical protein
VRPLRGRLSILFLAAIAAGLSAQEAGRIQGHIYSESGLAVAGAEVQIQNEWTGARQRLRSEADGGM